MPATPRRTSDADVKGGNDEAATYVLNRLGVQGTPRTAAEDGQTVPDVTGMGARDAVYELERVAEGVPQRSWQGEVAEPAAGKPVSAGMVCELSWNLKI